MYGVCFVVTEGRILCFAVLCCACTQVEWNGCADSTSTTFQPFFLNFYKVHSLALQFFLRMWNESGASTGDFPRLVALTRSQCVMPLLAVPENRRLNSVLR